MFIVCSLGVGLETGLFGLHYIRNEGISDHKRCFFNYSQCCFFDSVVIRMTCVFTTFKLFLYQHVTAFNCMSSLDTVKLGCLTSISLSHGMHLEQGYFFIPLNTKIFIHTFILRQHDHLNGLAGTQSINIHVSVYVLHLEHKLFRQQNFGPQYLTSWQSS